jgi:hypothetical protein
MLRYAHVLLLILLASACAPSEQATRDQRQAPAPRTSSALAPTDERVHTVQLYRTGSESAPPVLALGSGQTLTLELDLLDEHSSGPLSVFFYHADRNWNRRLLTVEYLQRFHSDIVQDYESSAATRVRYTHYTYRFPNNTIDFTRSGNFVVRVTEQGDERAVLLERGFFITEETAEVDLSVQSGLAAGLGGPMFQPVARVRPPTGFESPIHEFNVCFARDGRFDITRCAEEPTLLGMSLFQYFLPQERAFSPRGPRYELDLSVLGAGPHIASVDLGTSPYRVLLNADDARFGEAFFDDALRAGQSIIRGAVRDASRPEIQAEYVETTFRFVPHARERVAGRVILTGSFNGWAIDPRYSLGWDEEENEYRGTFLIKQGKHAYTYHVEDPAEQERRVRTADVGRLSLYSALVYLHDPAYNTDRLVSVEHVLGQ